MDKYSILCSELIKHLTEQMQTYGDSIVLVFNKDADVEEPINLPNYDKSSNAIIIYGTGN